MRWYITNHDSLPTARLFLANLSLVLRSIMQLTAIKSAMARKRLTRMHDRLDD